MEFEKKLKKYIKKEWQDIQNKNKDKWQCEKIAYDILPKFFGKKKLNTVPKNWYIISGNRINKNLPVTNKNINFLLNRNKKIIITQKFSYKINKYFINCYKTKTKEYKYIPCGHSFTLLKHNNIIFIIQSFVNKYKLSITIISNLQEFINDIKYMNSQKIYTSKYDKIYKKYFNSNLLSYNYNKSMIGKLTYNSKFLIDAYY